MSTKKKEDCLIIVDMQTGFLSTGQKQEQAMITHIKQRIKHYKKNSRPIMFLEYRGNAYNPDDNGEYGRTIQELQDTVMHYYNVAFVGKTNNDGSRWVERFLVANDQQDSFGTFELTGVNLDCCVVQTARGIAKKHPDCKIKIRQSCCSSRSSNMYGEAGEGIDRVLRVTNDTIEPYPNIKLIK